MSLDGRDRAVSGLLTVVFVDVEGSTALIDRLGDEEGTAVVQRQLVAVRERIEPYEGREVKSLGDGVMLTFQSPRLAVAFALAAQRELGDSVPRIRIGINTGEVVDDDGDPLGGVVNAAARIADKAKGGEVLVSEVVRQLAGSVPAIEFVDRGRVRLKGFPERWHLYAAVDHVSKRSSALTFGRADEVALVDDAVSSVAAGRGQVIVLEGEAGIGKTHLVHAAIDAAQSRRIRVVQGAADELEVRPGAIVRAWLDTIPASVPERHRLSTLLSSPQREVDDLDLGFAVMEATIDLFDAMGGAEPIVVVAEDLHWADDLSLRAVAAIARRVGPSPVVLVATCRPVPRPPLLDRILELVEAGRGHHLALAPLDDVAVCALASAHAGSPPGDALLARLATTAGNPLFVTELLRSLDDEGALHVNGGVVELDASELPATLRQTVVRRLSWLSSSGIELLRLASLLGGSFTLRDLAAVSGRSVVDVAAGLQEATRAAIVAGDGDRLRFRHDLIREAIYEDIDPAIRRDLHRAAGQALVAIDAPVMQVAQQLSLGARLGDLEAVEWLERAATEAAAYDPTTMIALTEKALALAPDDWPRRAFLEVSIIEPLSACGRLDEAEALAEHVRSSAADPYIEYGALRGLAAVLGNRGDIDACVEVLKRCATSAGAPEPEARINEVLAAEMSALIGVGDLDEHEAVARRALCDAEDSEDELLAAVSHQGLGVILSIAGYDEECAEHAAASAALLDRVGWHSYLTPEVFQALALMNLDRVEEGMALVALARRRAERSGATSILPLAMLGTGFGHYLLGRFDDAIASIEECVTLAEESTNRGFLLFNFGLLANIALHRGDLAAADHWLALGSARLTESGPTAGADQLLVSAARRQEIDGSEQGALDVLEMLWVRMAPVRYLFGSRRHATKTAQLAVKLGRMGLAEDVTAAVEEGARRSPAVSAKATARHCRGLLESDLDALIEAVDLHRSTGIVTSTAAVCEDTAVALLAAGREQEGIALLEEAATIHIGLGADADLSRVDGLLRGAGVRRRRPQAARPSTGWEALTRTELQVADLVAEGLTNPEIGARLYVSRRTIETHLSHVFAKCGLTNRAQLAAEVVKRRNDSVPVDA